MSQVRSIFRNKASRLIQSTQHLLYRMRGKQCIHFLHINKTGGSAIKEALKKNLVANQYYIHFHGHGYNFKNIADGEQVIFFLREPAARFVSGFNSRKRKGAPKYNYDWTAEETKAFEQFKTANALATALSSSDENLKRSAQWTMQNIHHVRTSYADWFIDKLFFEAKLDQIFFIGFQETLESDFKNLLLKLGLPENIQLPKDDTAAHKAPQASNLNLSGEAQKNLRQWYQKDFEFYFLCKQLKSKINHRH